MMAVSTRRMRNLEPARPLRRLNSHQVAEPVENPRETPINIRVEHFYVLKLHSQSKAPAKQERISYSRDFLIKLASVPMAKKKPDFLPDHPVVLDKGREPDMRYLETTVLRGSFSLNRPRNREPGAWSQTRGTRSPE